MREINVIIEDRSQAVFRPEKKRGRSKKTKKRVLPLNLDTLPSDFYRYVANLDKTEIESFLREYFVAVPFGDKKDSPASKEDILMFKRDLRLINECIFRFKKIPYAKTQHFISRKTTLTLKNGKKWSLMKVLNDYLSDTHLQLVIGPGLFQPLTKEERGEYLDQLEKMEDRLKKMKELEDGLKLKLPPEDEPTGLLFNDVLNFNQSDKRGRNFRFIVCRSNSLLSWCVLNFIVDKLFRKRPIGVCWGCNRLFEPRRKNVRYCDQHTSRKRNAARARKHYRTKLS